MLDINNIKIAVIGLGYVGLPLAVEFGKHRPVVGFDINTKRVQELRDGFDGTLEVDSEALKAANSLKIIQSDSSSTNAINEIFEAIL